MKSSAVVSVMAAMAVAAACLAAEPAAAQAHNTNRYGRQQLAQKQNRYGNTAWSSGRAAAAGWYGGTMMRHYPVSTGGRYLQTATMGRQGDDYGYDAADLQGGGYDPRPYDRLQDYAVVRYPSYGGGGGGDGAGLSAGGYYSQAMADQLYDEDLRLQQAYEDAVFGGHGGRGDPVAAAYSSSPYYPAAAAAAFNRYRPAAPVTMVRPYDAMMAGPPLARYHHPPTDKIHKFRKVFMSNLVSPSNAFKSTKEQQLYDFWESLINGDLDQDRDADADTGPAAPQQQYSRDDRQSLLAGDDSNSVTSQLYQHLPPIFQQLQQQQKLKQQRSSSTSSSVDQDRKSSSYQAYSSSSPVSASSSSSASSVSSSSSSAQQTVPRGNLYKQWANGSPLIKRSSSSSSADVRTPRPAALDNDDVRQLEKLKTDNAAAAAAVKARNATANTTAAAVTATAVADDDGDAETAVVAATPLMADGGQREYVLPRPAGEKSGFESLLEVIAEGGLHGNVDKNTAVAYRKLHPEAKVNKKRSYVSDETSLAAQLGALRKN